MRIFNTKLKSEDFTFLGIITIIVIMYISMLIVSTNIDSNNKLIIDRDTIVNYIDNGDDTITVTYTK